ncbi:phosphate/phosphite/phosphonate ABC transporter substrate-binding protein [Ruania alba]|uniref:Phosphonate transport system substrate-binding protein n=1 Tax=Ruania alba TaxID=648782 RepID=A0A1H5LZX9_9MICO|nr:phosphate/phosphite/phosphonate ABC transporter substrate-binding protein [Ruania alba]SEE82544.1 phosphonate transport system substrate-binding protein [Ruania alba]
MSRHRRTTLALTTLAASSLTLAACTSAADAGTSESGEMPETLIVAVIPSEDRTELDPNDSLPLRILERELDIEVEYHLATSYAATIEAQRSGQAHMAQYGPFSYVLAHDSGVDLELIGFMGEGPEDEGGYHSVASVRADSEIESLEDAAGQTVCFVDPASTSGYLFPTEGLISAGLDPETDINPLFAGGHDASVLALADGQCDLAFSTEGMATEQLLETGQIADGEIRQIWQSELIPSSPLTVSGSLPEGMTQQIREIYLEQINVDALRESGECDESAEDGMCGLGNWGYIGVEDSLYDGVRQVCEATEAEACTATEG